MEEEYEEEEEEPGQSQPAMRYLPPTLHPQERLRMAYVSDYGIAEGDRSECRGEGNEHDREGIFCQKRQGQKQRSISIDIYCIRIGLRN